MLLFWMGLGCIPEWDPDWLADTAGDSGSTGQTILINEDITSNTLWTAENTYLLADNTVIFVKGNSTLTIDAGTTVLGGDNSALIVTQGSKLFAEGEADAPVVFTSAAEPGSRERGDWGGVALLGNAVINNDGGIGTLEGLPDSAAADAQYGGSDDTYSCGKLNYVRIEFAGQDLELDKELNGLTLAGCGSGTNIRYVQVHYGKDDGIELFGGTASMRNIVISRSGDDSLDWDLGWRGQIQFLIIQLEQENTEEFADKAFESNGEDGDNEQPYDNEPFSNPTIYNATLIGSNVDGSGETAMGFRAGTGGLLRNFVVTGFPRFGIDIDSVESATRLTEGDLSLENMIFFDTQLTVVEDAESDDDGGFDEAAWFSNPDLNITIEDPLFTAGVYELEAPDFVPALASPAATGAAAIPSSNTNGFWSGVPYLGAVEPGATTPWYEGWTDFPPN
ncbi:MAG: hypothetical protein AAFV53_13435 [Myxococcota bacterium]